MKIKSMSEEIIYVEIEELNKRLAELKEQIKESGKDLTLEQYEQICRHIDAITDEE